MSSGSSNNNFHSANQKLRDFITNHDKQPHLFLTLRSNSSWSEDYEKSESTILSTDITVKEFHERMKTLLHQLKRT